MPGLSLPDGTPTGGVFGFASIAIELIKKLEPDYVAVAWDKRGTNIRARREIYPEYKSGRKKAPEDFYAQMPILFELLEAFGWPLYELDDYEADDIMGAFAREAEAKGVETCLLTSDLDALQLVSPMTKVYAMKNGLSNIEEFDVEHFENKYGIRIDQYLDYKSLKGDSSDAIPGVPGIGDKTARELLNQFGSLDEIYNNLKIIKPSIAKKLIDGKELAYVSKKLSRIWTEAPVDLDWSVADVQDTDLDKVSAILTKLEFNSLARRLPKHMQPTHHAHALYIEDKHVAELVESAWPDTLNIDGPVFAHFDSNKLWISNDGKTAHGLPVDMIPKSHLRAIEMSKVVAYDVKALYHDLSSVNMLVRFDEVHDIRQAAFLIDPLRRDRSLSGLIGEEIKTPIDYLTALTKIYLWQDEAFRHMPKVYEIAKKLDFPLTYHLFMMEHIGVEIDTVKLRKMSNDVTTEHSKLEQEMYSLVGHEFNIGSPMQLSQVIFDELKLPTVGIKKGKTGYSTAQKELDSLRGKHPIIELIERTRELAKLKNTYIDVLPALADSSNRVHTTFNQDGAATGRLSSTNPNLQNIPTRTELGRRIRESFIAPSGKVLINADYSQFELRLAAVLANDTKMVEDFNRGGDIHTKTASEVYNVPIDSVTKSQRRNAKVINFGVLYGMSPHGLSVATGMPISEAKIFIDKYFSLREPIRKYLDEVMKQARIEGYVETFYGRRRPTPDIHSSNFVVRSSAERAAANMPIQGTEADLMKRAMIQIDAKIEGLGKQLLQIHDSILLEVPKENANKVSDIVRSVMENIAPELNIKLEVDINIGHNWGDIS